MSYEKRFENKIVNVIWVKETCNFTQSDWVQLAIAALDQANISPEQLARAWRHGKGAIESTIKGLDIED